MPTTKMEEVNDLSISRRNDDEDEEASDEDDDDEVTTHAETTGQFRRDEVCEVRKLSSKDTSRLRLWRIVVTGVLLLTALVVTFTTYTLLKKQEDKNFQTAVRFYLFFQSSIPARCTSIFTHYNSLSTSSNNLRVQSVMLQSINKHVCGNHTSVLQITYPQRLDKQMRRGHSFVYHTSNYMLDKLDCKVDQKCLAVHTGSSRVTKVNI